jgi:hypothetical protein
VAKRISHRRSRFLQPFISFTPRAAAIGLRVLPLHHCRCCGAPLASHFHRGNRWIGCRKAGVR